MKKSLKAYFDGTMINEFTNGIGNDAIHIRDTLVERYSSLEILRFKNQSGLPHKMLRISSSRQTSNLKLLLFGFSEICPEPADIFIQTQANSLSMPNARQTFIRIHDVFPITNPEWFSIRSVIFFKKCIRKLRSDSIYLCNSESTAESLRKYLSIPDFQIKVLYCAIAKGNSVSCSNCEGCNLDEPERYGIAVGTIEPRKDYRTLLNAWKSASTFDSQISLVIIGKYGWKQKRIARKLRRSKSERIYWLSDACNGSVAKLRKKAAFFVSTSLNEGFNISAAEACADGIPLIISDIPVHREIHPEAYFFSPGNVIELVERVRKMDTLNFSKASLLEHSPYGHTQFSSELNEILDSYRV